MTQVEFCRKAEKKMRKDLELPPGTWGTYEKIYSRKGQVTFSKHNDKWIVRRYVIPGMLGGVSSRHDERKYALQALTRMV